MKKKTIITILLFIAAITVNAQFLFRITSGGLSKPSYILGSIHTSIIYNNVCGCKEMNEI